MYFLDIVMITHLFKKLFIEDLENGLDLKKMAEIFQKFLIIKLVL